MEKLLSHETYSGDGIAIMKNLMNRADEDYHALITVANTGPIKSDPGTMVLHRVKFELDLDKQGVVQADIDILSKHRKELQPTIDNISAIYQEGGSKRHTMLVEIDKLKKSSQKKCLN